MKLKLNVSGISGRVCSVTLDQFSTLEDIKAAIFARTGIPVTSQRLFRKDAELKGEGDLRYLLPGFVHEDVITYMGGDIKVSGQMISAGTLGQIVEVQGARAKIWSEGVGSFWTDRDLLKKPEEGLQEELLLVRRSSEQARWLTEVEQLHPYHVWDWLENAPAGARHDKEVALAVVRREGAALTLLPEELKADRDVVLEAVKQNGYVLQYVAAEFQADRDIVLAAVARDGLALYFAPEELRADHGVVLAAIKQNGCALDYAAAELHADRDLRSAQEEQYEWQDFCRSSSRHFELYD